MPAKDAHLKRSGENLGFYVGLQALAAHPKEWRLTAIFYACLHLVDAYLATKGYHPPEHKVRDGYVEKLGDLKPIDFDYKRLKGWSIQARYQADSPLLDKQIATALQIHGKIESHIKKLIATP